MMKGMIHLNCCTTDALTERYLLYLAESFSAYSTLQKHQHLFQNKPSIVRAHFNEATKVRTKSDSDRDFRWLKLFFSSRDSYWS